MLGSKIGKADIIIKNNDGSLTVRDDWFNKSLCYKEKED